MARLTIPDLYTREGTALVSRDREWATEIGDTKASEFLPQAKFGRLDNEFNLSLRLVTADSRPARIEERGPAIEYARSDLTARFYDKGFHDGGAYAFDVVFPSRPSSNVVRFTVQSKDVVFYPQPALTARQLIPSAAATPHQRPEHILDSYAIYYAPGRRHFNQYKAGKFGHLYRPFAEDANRVRVWCDMTLTGTDLTVTIPQAFLDSAVYPVTLDPDFGNTTAGGSTVNVSAGYMVCYGDDDTNGYAAPSSGTSTSVSLYGHTSNVTIDITLGFYTDAGIADAKVADSAGGTINAGVGGPEWFTQTVSGGTVTSGSEYWIAQNHDTDVLTQYYDLATAGAAKYTLTAYASGTLTDPFPQPVSGELDNEFSVYITYTATAGASARFTTRRRKFYRS